MGIFVKNSSQLTVGYLCTVGDIFNLVYSVDTRDIWLSQAAMSCSSHLKKNY